jgi:DNA-directed RNA polymerase specialized sigma24 family protein
MMRNSNSLFNLAEALSEDIVARTAIGRRASGRRVPDSHPEWPRAVPADTSLRHAEAAIRSLTAADQVALMTIARLYARKTPYDYEDLLQEAFARVLSGRRAWPHDLAAVPFLWGVMRSIAREWKKKVPDTLPEGADPGGEERLANASLDVAKILALFDDDPVAQVIVRGMMEGAHGLELQDLSGLDKTDYESKRTKIRRGIEKLWDVQPTKESRHSTAFRGVEAPAVSVREEATARLEDAHTTAANGAADKNRIVDLAAEELDRFAGEAWGAAAREALARGLPVTGSRDGRRVRYYPDGRHEDLGPVAPLSHEKP